MHYLCTRYLPNIFYKISTLYDMMFEQNSYITVLKIKINLVSSVCLVWNVLNVKRKVCI